MSSARKNVSSARTGENEQFPAVQRMRYRENECHFPGDATTKLAAWGQERSLFSVVKTAGCRLACIGRPPFPPRLIPANRFAAVNDTAELLKESKGGWPAAARTCVVSYDLCSKVEFFLMPMWVVVGV